MYSQDEINSAVASGALSEDAANGLRAHVAELRSMPVANEEQFRLITSFNDIFVAIGVIIMLVAVGAIGGAMIGGITPDNVWQASLMGFVPSALVAGTAWFLAEVFTRKRRMALPSIILLLAFVGAIFVTTASIVFLPFGLIFGPGSFAAAEAAGWEPDETTGAIVVALMLTITGAITTGLTWLHWRRFTAAGAVASISLGNVVLIAGFAGLLPNVAGILPVVFGLLAAIVAGIGVSLVTRPPSASCIERVVAPIDAAFGRR